MEFFKGNASMIGLAIPDNNPSLFATLGKVAIFIPAYGRSEKQYKAEEFTRIFFTKKTTQYIIEDKVTQNVQISPANLALEKKVVTKKA